jgi:hypothetical protein
MADNIPNIPNIPAGAVPPKKETGKVQPKKETVRINLPPKPSAAPTIKLPTLPPGGPTAGPAATGAPAAGAPLTAKAPGAPAPTARPAPTAAQAAPRATAAPSVARPAPMPAAPTVSTIDKVLAIAAAVVGLVGAASTGYLIWMLQGLIPS